MSQYLLSVYSATGTTREPMTEDQMQRGFARIAALESEMKTAGALVFSGRLLEPSTATVVRASNGKVMTTDGPYAEAKEAIAGFYILDADDLDAALSWASKTSAAINEPIEVRPFWEHPGG
jgi:hypothetical protein